MGADGNDPSELKSAGFTIRTVSLTVYTPKIQFAISDQRKILHRFLLSDFIFRYTYGTGPYSLIRLTELPSNTWRIYTRLSFSKNVEAGEIFEISRKSL